MEEPMNVLLVDDDSSILHALTARLEHLGCRVAAATDAMSVLSELHDVEPDVAIIDINLPGRSGFDLARMLDARAAEAARPAVRKIFLTASKDSALRAQAEDLGAFGYLEKPYSPADLGSMLAECRRELAGG